MSSVVLVWRPCSVSRMLVYSSSCVCVRVCVCVCVGVGAGLCCLSYTSDAAEEGVSVGVGVWRLTHTKYKTEVDIS